MDRFRAYYYVLSFVFFVAALWVGFFLDIKIEAQYIPTLVNGIASSLSVIVGFTGAIIGIMLREIEKYDKKAKEFYFRALVLLMLPLTLLWTTYTFLTVDMSKLSVNAALSGLISALYVFIMVIVFTVKNLTTNSEKKTTQELSSPNDDKKDISKEKTAKAKIENKTEKESNIHIKYECMNESAEERQKKLDRLDNAFLFIVSLIGLLFTIIQVATEGIMGLLEISPLLVLGVAVPFYIGYIRGAIECNSLIERARGWVYLTVGVIAYFAFFIQSFGVTENVGFVIYAVIVTFGAFSVYYLEKWFTKFFNIRDNITNLYAFYGTAVASVSLAYVSRMMIIVYPLLFNPALHYSDYILSILSMNFAFFLTALGLEKISRQAVNLNLTFTEQQMSVLARFRNRVYVMSLDLFGSLVFTVLKKKHLLLYLTAIYSFIAVFLFRFPILFDIFVLSAVVVYSLGVLQFLKSGKADFSTLGESIREQEEPNTRDES